VDGVRVKYGNAQMLHRLDFSKGKRTYLSDLEPASVEQTSTEDRVEHYRRDKNLDDGPLRLAGRSFAKGLALHSRTVLVYNIGGEYKDFKAWLGVDDQVGGDSQAQVTIEGDGKVLFATEVRRKDERLRPEYAEVLAVAAPVGFPGFVPWPALGKTLQAGGPIPVALDVRGVKQLRITVSSEFLDLGNHVDLADAKVSK
jgi:hypothetical protein